MQALIRALRQNLTSADKTKAGTFNAGWGRARSSTDPRYRRASQRYKLAVGRITPFVGRPRYSPKKKQRDQASLLP